MGYYFYHPPDHKVFVAREKTILERRFSQKEIMIKKLSLHEVQENDEAPKAQEHGNEVWCSGNNTKVTNLKNIWCGREHNYAKQEHDYDE